MSSKGWMLGNNIASNVKDLCAVFDQYLTFHDHSSDIYLLLLHNLLPTMCTFYFLYVFAQLKTLCEVNAKNREFALHG